VPLRFPYLPLPTRRPVPSLGGATVRYRPLLAVRLRSPSGSRLFDGCLDSASDDVLFPRRLAAPLGIDLVGATQGEAWPVGGVAIPYLYARVTLQVTDGREECTWEATVGFVDQPLRWALLGHAGFLEFFDTELRGDRREAILTPNPSFPGRHVVHQPPPP
jgi:hypothetical protein